jgi:hypothetical protein
MSAMQRIVVLIAMAILCPALVLGQGGFAAIEGTVKDNSGGVIPGATVTATNVATNQKTSGVTTDIGFFRLAQLLPGNYSVKVEFVGFKSLERPGLELRVGDRVALDLKMEVGETTDTVTVTGETPLLRTGDAQTGEVVTNLMIRNLPQLNRDPLQLLTLAGNVQGGGGRATAGSDTRINGGRTIGVDYIIDGVTAGTGIAHDVVRTIPTTETIGEFRVITNGISAEYGRMSGGAVELITRGGTNQFHGELFEYNKNDAFNANSWQQNALGGKKAHFTNNIYGGVIGGPVWIPKIYDGHDKTFFFFNYEGTRYRQAGTIQETTVMTELERAGDFSQTVYNNQQYLMYDQWGTLTYNDTTKQWLRQDLLGGDGLHIPANRISPVSKALLKYMPLPNQAPRPGSSSVVNFRGVSSSQANNDTWSARIDHQITANQKLFGRFITRDNASGNTRFRGSASTASENFVPNGWGLTLSYDWTLSPTLVLNARAGGNYNPYRSGNLIEAGTTSADVPWDATTGKLLGGSFPWVDLSRTSLPGGNAARYITQAPSEAWNASTTYDSSLSVSKILNRHSLKFGFQHRRYYDNFNNSAGGTFRFMATPVMQQAGIDPGFGADICLALAPASFLLGVNNYAEVVSGRTRALNMNYDSAYVQDDWKVTPRLTLNVGLRWDMQTPVTERFDKLYVWDPEAPAPFTINPGYDFKAAVQEAGLDPAKVPTPSWVTNGFPKGALAITNTPERPTRHGTDYYPWQFAPRFGMAYQINPKTVLRASFGEMFISTTGYAAAYSGEGLKLSESAVAGWHASNDGALHMISTWDNPYQPGQYSPYSRTSQAANYDATTASSPLGYSAKTKMPYELTWHVGVQREMWSGLLVEANYSGNGGRDLLGPENLGLFPKQYFSGGPTGENFAMFSKTVASPTAGQTLENNWVGTKQRLAMLMFDRPYFGVVAVPNANIGRSNYHSLNLRAERRMSRGIAFLANYTFSRSKDDVGGPDRPPGVGWVNLGQKEFQSVDQITDYYGISTIDETHRFSGYYNIQLPFGRGRKWLGNPHNLGTAILDHLVGGWEVAQTAVLRSGRPVVLRAVAYNTNNAYGIQHVFGSFAEGQTTIVDDRFQDPSQVLYSSRDAIPANAVRKFDPAKVVNAQVFTYGTLPSVFEDVRHPGRVSYDLSLMKAFYFRSQENVYLQFRMEASNVFNYHGFGDYNVSVGSALYGFIQGVRNSPREIQMSARLVF